MQANCELFHIRKAKYLHNAKQTQQTKDFTRVKKYRPKSTIFAKQSNILQQQSLKLLKPIKPARRKRRTKRRTTNTKHPNRL